MNDMLLFAPMVQRTVSAVPCGDNRMNLTMRTSTTFLRQAVAEKRPKPDSFQFLQQPVAEIGNVPVPPPTILSRLVRKLPTARHARLAVGAASTLAVFLFETHQETKPVNLENRT